MTQQEKTEFIESFFNSTKEAILRKVKYMPEEWGGLELWEYIADDVDQNCRYMSRKANKTTYRKRLREYRNTLLTTSL